MSTDPMSEIQRGDPDPTDGPPERAVCAARRSCWSCTRWPDHTGQHVAGTGWVVCAVWPGES